jgi:hypothetical protein
VRVETEAMHAHAFTKQAENIKETSARELMANVFWDRG